MLETINTTATSAPAISKSNEERVQRVRMSRLRKTIAQRLKDSQNTAAILTTFIEIDMSKVIALRNHYKEEFEKSTLCNLGLCLFLLKQQLKL